MRNFYSILFCLMFSGTFASSANYTSYYNKYINQLESEFSVSGGFLAAPSSKHNHTDNDNCMIVYLPFGLTISQSPAIYSVLRSKVCLNDFVCSFSVNSISSKQPIAILANDQPIGSCLVLNRNVDNQNNIVDVGKTEKNVLKESINWTALLGANETCTEEGSLFFLLNSPANNLPIKYVNMIPKARYYVAAILGVDAPVYNVLHNSLELFSINKK